MKLEHRRLGSLDCSIVDALPEGTRPSTLVVLCHGYGAPATDLMPLAGELYRQQPQIAEQVRFCFPAAPLSLDEMGIPEGRAWWPLNVARLQQAIATGELGELRSSTPPGMPEARAALVELVGKLREDEDNRESRLILGGFSQGAMVSTDAALRMEQPPETLCIFSGTLLCEAEWSELATTRQELQVIQSHGRQDPVLPFAAAEWLRDVLLGAGLNVDFLPFNGGHTISSDALIKLRDCLLTG